MTMNAIAIHEKAVLSVEIPRTKNTIPRRRKIVELLRLFSFIVYYPFDSLFGLDLGIRRWILK